MYVVYFDDGTTIATSSQDVANEIMGRPGALELVYVEDLDVVTEIATYVEE